MWIFCTYFWWKKESETREWDQVYRFRLPFQNFLGYVFTWSLCFIQDFERTSSFFLFLSYKYEGREWKYVCIMPLVFPKLFLKQIFISLRWSRVRSDASPAIYTPISRWEKKVSRWHQAIFFRSHKMKWAQANDKPQSSFLNLEGSFSGKVK